MARQVRGSRPTRPKRSGSSARCWWQRHSRVLRFGDEAKVEPMVQVFTLSEVQQAYVQQHADLQQLPIAEPDRPEHPDLG